MPPIDISDAVISKKAIKLSREGEREETDRHREINKLLIIKTVFNLLNIENLFSQKKRENNFKININEN